MREPGGQELPAPGANRPVHSLPPEIDMLFYKPQDAWAADFIPYWRDGVYYLFYLHDWRDIEGHGEGTPWYLITTRDFVHFTEHGQMLARGPVGTQDLFVFTGSVIEAEGRFHILYTGHNHHLQEQGLPAQAIMRAESDDLLTWRKAGDEMYFAPTDRFEPNDWRDPFVFWNPEAGEYWMLLAARLPHGPSRRRGCTALCASPDLMRWEAREPLYAPGLYYTHECPDLFRMGEWWYLVFSEFSDTSQTRYRMARSLSGPWVAPANDAFDARTLYAAKTASDGDRRFLFGWNPTRTPATDAGGVNWGGSLVVHEIVQDPDGTLRTRIPDTVDAAFAAGERDVALTPALGECAIDGRCAMLTAGCGLALASGGAMPDPCRISTTVAFEPGTRAFGIALRMSDDYEKAYYIRLEPDRARLVFDVWPRPGDVPFVTGLERPIALQPGDPITLTVLVEGTVCEVYAGDRIALSLRLYDHAAGEWGFFVQEGAARFTGTRLSCPGGA